MNNVLQIAGLVLLLPLAGFLVNGLGRNRLSRRMVSLIGCGTVFLSFLVSAGIFSSVQSGNTHIARYFTFINIPSLQVDFSLQFDALSSLFLMIITGVGFLIHLYSTAYMKEEETKDYARYFSYLNLFVFSMLLLVLGANYVILFIGWEGVGLCSYLLIGYWFKNKAYNLAAQKAFIMNRIGDLGFLLAIFWLISKTGTTSFSAIFSPEKLNLLTTKDITWITLFLFVGATGKSAQIPLYTWLPDAMAGPTPVSALIHAATMVTAGIYMIVRSHALYSLAPVTMEIVAVVGLATALLAASIALFQNDIKKVLAYSTISQLGYMFLALGVGAYTSSVFHVMTHAFFKALLFLGAGSVIHAMSGEQDITKMGGLSKKIPVTYFTFLIGVLAISGFPFTSGFISKDEILLQVYNSGHKVYFYLAATCSIITAFYMFRLLALTFWGGFRGTKAQDQHLHESPRAMTVPLVILAILSVVGGLVQLPAIFGGHPYLNEFMDKVVSTKENNDPMMATKELLILAVTVIGLASIYFITRKWYIIDKVTGEYSGFKKVLANKWYVDELYDAVITRPLGAISRFFQTMVENKSIDGFVNGIGKAVQYGGRQFRLLQNGQVGVYILMMVLGIAGLILLMYYQVMK